MKKNVLILSALCFAAMTLVFSGCKKETNDPQEPAKVQTYQMSIQASKGADNQANGPRRVISLGDGGTLTAEWQTGDVVSVFNLTKLQQLEGVLRAQSNGVNTLLTGTLSGTVEVGDNLQLRYKSKSNPYYKNQNGTLDHISANCDYATATVTVAAVNDGVITTDADATFQNEQAIFKFTLLNNANGAALSATELVVNVGEDTYTVTPASATSVMYVALSFGPYTGPQTVTLTATADDGTYTKTVICDGDELLENGKYYQITVSMTKQAAPAYKEYGPFSVSSTQKVNFSQGNLKYTKSTGKFEFMTNQYDRVETNNQNVGDDYDNQDVISLFGWATSNINTPVANTYYYPYETDDSEGNRAKYGSGITTKDVNWATAHANYDWGANTGDLGTGWRTLTTAEWQYLFNRTVNGGTGNGKSYTLGQSVNGKPGAVFYPDNYTGA
ncbi:MAG: hypothetical protein J6M55_06145, partial [Paludibacteraceae bacterium]|nr:hypothetical protein [Paludibacteraceae bacterium]